MQQSDGFSQAISGLTSYYQNLQGGVLDLWSGTIPATANLAQTGTLLATLTNNGGAMTFETQAQWSITLSGTTSGSVNTITLGNIPILPSAVNYATSFTNTAALVAAAINAAQNTLGITAVPSGAIIYLYAPHGSGTSLNSVICAATATTLTATVASAGSPSTAGVAAVNALTWAFPVVSAGVGALINGTGTWSTTSAIATGTIGYGVLRLDSADNWGANSTYRRILLTAGTSGTDIITLLLNTTQGSPLSANIEQLYVYN